LNGAAKVIGKVITENTFEFDFTVYSKTNKCGAADIVPGSGCQIWGVLYDIPEERIFRKKCPEGLKCLDAIEGEGINYVRDSISVCYPDGTRVKDVVITYVAKERKTTYKTSIDYVRHIINGLRSNEIPESYIEYVKQRIVRNNPLLDEDVELL
jgi:hypothetical protein